MGGMGVDGKVWEGGRVVENEKRQPMSELPCCFEPLCGLEPQTYALRMRCSTN